MDSIVKLESRPDVIRIRKRVAAYARVSSGKDAMLHSLAAQVAYYSDVIQRNPEWKYAGVYADEAISGTKEARPEFQRLMEDCREGKIDLILTKSISRFARNTVTALEMVRELRTLGVDVWFERENIHSIGADGEFIFTILSSFAEEESISASENQKWKIRKNFAEGIPTATIMYGYDYDNGVLVINPEEAENVRMIFNDYLSGMGVNAIARKLCNLGIPTKNGCAWRQNVILGMLRNEKYKGDMLLQKTFRPDHLRKMGVKNEGQLAQYYVEHTHEAIITPELFGLVQEELKRRSRGKRKTPANTYAFTGKIICEKCGKTYQHKKTASGPKWCCFTYNHYGKAYCDAQQIPESVLEGIVGERDFQQIRVPDAGVIKVIWKDGSENIYHWQNPSRSESWTEEMRREAGERRKEWKKGRSK